ncbi:hypothetical protein K0M31_006478 [Melipona bicolor]|uniref:Uncharacterized protein n=1 Tax=Melipona bicolor TaxID=60889 RepID=A0AA40FTN2_9HYME|nr:hypothetical protein K0M31_006478 [Melipona bicolor]
MDAWPTLSNEIFKRDNPTELYGSVTNCAPRFHTVISSPLRRISRGTCIHRRSIGAAQSRLIRSIGSTGLKETRLYASAFFPLSPPSLFQRLPMLPFFARRMTGTLLSDVYRKPAEKKRERSLAVIEAKLREYTLTETYHEDDVEVEFVSNDNLLANSPTPRGIDPNRDLNEAIAEERKEMDTQRYRKIRKWSHKFVHLPIYEYQAEEQEKRFYTIFHAPKCRKKSIPTLKETRIAPYANHFDTHRDNDSGEIWKLAKIKASKSQEQRSCFACLKKVTGSGQLKALE